MKSWKKKEEGRMNTAYEKELQFMMRILEKMRMPVRILHPGDAPEGLDRGLRSLLNMEEDYAAVWQTAMKWTSRRTIYKVVDQFLCHYIYFQLPAATPPGAVVIGPYLTMDPSHEMLLEQTEQLGLPMNLLPQQTDYYASLPVFADPSPIMAVIYSFGEVIWNGAASFDVVDVNFEHQLPLHTADQARPIERDDILQQMKQLEDRYAYENELMETVSKGLINRAEVMMSSVSQLNYQQRLSDPLRNMKNYCIICNTLLRKAAQQGGVHPVHLDEMSSNFARTIENSPSLETCNALIGDMIRSYCYLVRTHASQHYSPIVQKVVTYIDANLSGDLSLPTLARRMQITPGYLSALFHREAGRSLSDHIAAQRMKTALQLISNTQLQVQTVAQLCGFADPNYFGKQFKRTYGVTPLQFRKGQLRPVPSPES